jgi:hypothetical protein
MNKKKGKPEKEATWVPVASLALSVVTALGSTCAFVYNEHKIKAAQTRVSLG